jgi:hypothetical protein
LGASNLERQEHRKEYETKKDIETPHDSNVSVTICLYKFMTLVILSSQKNQLVSQLNK